jgi:hypothetical protein
MINVWKKTVHKIFEARLGARTSYCLSSDLHAGLELDTLKSIGIENRVIGRALGFSSYAGGAIERIVI